MGKKWYFSKNGRACGPVPFEEILEKVQSSELNLIDLVYQEGESEWQVLGTLPEFNRRKSNPKSLSIDLPEEGPEGVPWVVLVKKQQGNETHFIQSGPYSTDQVKAKLDRGEFKYSDYIWRAGFAEWCSIGRVIDFDRRSIVSQDTGLTRKENEIILESVENDTPDEEENVATEAWLVGEAKPAEASGVDEVEKHQQSHRVIPPVLPLSSDETLSETTESSPLEKEDRVEEEEESEEKTEITTLNRKVHLYRFFKKKPLQIALGVFVLAFLFTGSYFYLSHERTQKTQLSSKSQKKKKVRRSPPTKSRPIVKKRVTQPPKVKKATKSKEERQTPIASKKRGKELTAKKLGVSNSPKVLNLLPKDLSNKKAAILIQTDIPVGRSLNIRLVGSTGQILKFPAYENTFSLKRTSLEFPKISLQGFSLPPGYYRVYVNYGHLNQQRKFFLGKMDPQFWSLLKAHRKQISFQQQEEKKQLWKISGRFSEFLRQAKRSLRQPKKGRRYYTQWWKKVKAHYVTEFNQVRRQNRWLAFPRMWKELKDIHQEMVKKGQSQAKKRGVASASWQRLAQRLDILKKKSGRLSGWR